MAKQPDPTWSDLNAELAQFDRVGLLGLLKDLHALGPENRALLAARLGVGDTPLAPIRKIISRWIYPDISRRLQTSVAKAKKAIADCRKAIGRPEGMAELSILYCEKAARPVGDCGSEDKASFSALVRMFQQALTHATPCRQTNATECSSASMPSVDRCAGSSRASPMP